MKTLAEYLSEYIVTESFGLWNAGNLQEWIGRGIEAYQSTENCTIGICGGNCPDCNNGRPMERGVAVLYSGCDEIEVCKYECPECGYVVYG